MSHSSIVVLGAYSELGKALVNEFKSGKVFAVGKNLCLYKKDPTVVEILGPDLTNSEEMKLVAGKIFDEVPGNSLVIIHAIGRFGYRCPLHKVSDELVTDVLGTNLKVFINAYREFLPYMIERKNGMFVTFGSISDPYNYPQLGLYNAAKIALKSLITTAANEQHQNGICFFHFSFSTLYTEREKTANKNGDYKNWLKTEEAAHAIKQYIDTSATLNRLCNKFSIDLFHYSDTYFNKGYFERAHFIREEE